MPDESKPLDSSFDQDEAEKAPHSEEDNSSKVETVEALLAVSLESEVPAERARAVQALNAVAKDEASNEKAEGAVATPDSENEDDWVELYGIDEEYAQMVRETLGESAGPDGTKPQFREEFEDDE